MSAERCDSCGKFGARKSVKDLGPDGVVGREGARATLTSYLCSRCEDRAEMYEREAKKRQEEMDARMKGNR